MVKNTIIVKIITSDEKIHFGEVEEQTLEESDWEEVAFLYVRNGDNFITLAKSDTLEIIELEEGGTIYSFSEISITQNGFQNKLESGAFS